MAKPTIPERPSGQGAMKFKLGKQLRRDVRSRIGPIMARAQILAMIDPDFAAELEASGLDQAFQAITGTEEERESFTTHDVRKVLRSVRAKRRGDRAPLKFFRRSLRQDVGLLLEEIQFLRQLDPAVDEEVQRLGLERAFERFG